MRYKMTSPEIRITVNELREMPMMTFLSISAVVLSIVGTIIAIFVSGGQVLAYDPKLRGLRRITRAGWATCCFIVLLAISICLIVVGDREKTALEAKLDFATQEITSLKETASTQVKIAELEAQMWAHNQARHGSIKRAFYRPMGGLTAWHTTAPLADHPFIAPYQEIEGKLKLSDAATNTSNQSTQRPTWTPRLLTSSYGK